MFRKRKGVYYSGGLYAVQESYMDVQEGYMLKKILMFIKATNIVASQLRGCQPTGTPTARANFSCTLKLKFCLRKTK